MKQVGILLGCLMALTALQHSAAMAAGCYGGEGGAVESMVRKEEAVRLAIELELENYERVGQGNAFNRCVACQPSRR